MVELEFSFDDLAYPFVGASAAENCTVELEALVPRGEGAYAEFFSVRGADVDASSTWQRTRGDFADDGRALRLLGC